MSGDTLRRAAAVLREHVARMPEPWRTHPWRQVQSDTESMDAIAACTRNHAGTGEFGLDEHSAWDCCWSSGEGGLGHETVAAYAALLRPAVALALADWLDDVRWEAQIQRRDAIGMRATAGAARLIGRPVDLARAILRESAEGGAP